MHKYIYILKIYYGYGPLGAPILALGIMGANLRAPQTSQ